MQITARGLTDAEYRALRVLAAHANVSVNALVVGTLRALIKAEAAKLKNTAADSDVFKTVQRELRGGRKRRNGADHE